MGDETANALIVKMQAIIAERSALSREFHALRRELMDELTEGYLVRNLYDDETIRFMTLEAAKLWCHQAMRKKYPQYVTQDDDRLFFREPVGLGRAELRVERVLRGYESEDLFLLKHELMG